MEIENLCRTTLSEFMIKLTEINGNDVLVRIEHIQAAQINVKPSMVLHEKATTTTTIFMTFGLRFEVRETPEEILKHEPIPTINISPALV